MKLKLLSFLLTLLVLAACRNDHLQDLHYQNEGTKSQLVSKIISLNESVHKHKLLPQLKTAKENIKKTMPKNKFGKMVSFGDSISIDTDQVIYIENGPNYHTYTFAIQRENPLPGNPLENLVLSLLPDGSYQELLVTYDLTLYEKQQLYNGLQINTDGKVTFSELSIGTFNNGQLLQARTFCNYVSHSVVIPCSETNSSTGQPVHHEGNMSTWHHCTADRPPQHITVGYWDCVAEPVDETLMPTDPGGSGGGGGEGEDPGTPPDDTECSLVAGDPNEVGIMDPNGCIPGIPTQPNLPNPKNNPCEKTKATYENTAVKSRYEILKGKTSEPSESGYGFRTVTDGKGGTTTQTNPLNPDLNNSDKMKVSIFPTSYGYIHTHLDKRDNKMSIKIFSPADLNTFIVFLNNAKSNNTPLGNIFGGMIASDPNTGHNIYQIHYTGNGNDLPTKFTKEEIDVLRNEYLKMAQETANENEGGVVSF